MNHKTTVGIVGVVALGVGGLLGNYVQDNHTPSTSHVVQLCKAPTEDSGQFACGRVDYRNGAWYVVTPGK
jgi:hypothetical protein